MQDKIYYFATFNLQALLSLAEQRRGQPCTCDITQMPKCGSLNWVIFICFPDGVEWAFRSPKSGVDSLYSDETASRILVSEASTLLYLKANTSIPVPQVFSYSGSKNTDIGIPYILQSKATGRSLGSYAWSPPRHRFDKIGSLFQDGDSGYAVGECLSPSLTWQDRDSLELDRGPFKTEHDYFVSLVSAFTSHAKELSLTPHVFFAPVPDMGDYESLSSYQKASRRWSDFVAIGQKIEHSKNILFYCIVGQFLSEMIPDLASNAANGFTISHPDLHIGNIYVDENFNITSIIDWSSASIGPVSETLAAPPLGSSAVSPYGFLYHAYRASFIREAIKTGQEVPNVSLWKTSERMWYFSRLTRLLSKNDHQLFERLFRLTFGMDACMGREKEILWLFDERAIRKENVKLLAILQEDDLSTEELLEKERACFPPKRTVNKDSIAVARKLTLMSEMNPLFLADHRLWKWIDKCLEHNEL
ncbi:kinase-like domain-containing protein [Fusarium mexicanum]|uniref:Kinase-like domain-containing protein n=1 Tax=Fusarium mexicanum TaxID=751941 RepID=A0A8H5N231_9HYPO|nr:kinase-like domain-containing protein [Fusarium mexicanum]